MKKCLFILFILSTITCHAQKKGWTKLIYYPILKIITSFTKNWDYNWYIVKHEDGSFENTMSDSVTLEDTIHQYYTAACTNTHMGSHPINYCKAYLYNNDVELHFSGHPPGYNEEMIIFIRKNDFSGEYNFQFVAPQKDKEISYEIVSQKITLKGKPVYGKMITGIIEIKFRERISYTKNQSANNSAVKPIIAYSKIYSLKGKFYTPLNDILEIE